MFLEGLEIDLGFGKPYVLKLEKPANKRRSHHRRSNRYKREQRWLWKESKGEFATVDSHVHLINKFTLKAATVEEIGTEEPKGLWAEWQEQMQATINEEIDEDKFE